MGDMLGETLQALWGDELFELVEYVRSATRSLRDAEDRELRDELIAKLDETMVEVEAVLSEVDPVALLARVTVQGMEETVLTVIVHVVEHFSYHTGQITYAVKSRKGIDLGYYEGLDLNAKNT